MQLIRVATGKKKVLAFVKKLGYADMYNHIHNLPRGSECDLFFDIDDERFKAIVDQNNVERNKRDVCIRNH